MCDPANDFIWTNRILVWVADLLLFCFGDNHRWSAEERLQRWSTLKTAEEGWKEAKPAPYKPIPYHDREPTVGKHFPEIWHMNSCQVAGAQHIELGRILLAVSVPRRAPRLGPGALSRDKAPVQELQDCTRRLCGLAVSNPPCPAAIVTAMVGISVCGEYFTDPGEQSAMIRLLEELEWGHAWPTASTINALQTAWGSSTGGNRHCFPRLLAYLFILPLVRYFHDLKGLRKYPVFSPPSGFTDLRHIYLSACGYRSKELYEAHRRAPISKRRHLPLRPPIVLLLIQSDPCCRC
ncbi:hypothetical protein BP00DRAFT_451699 [Aspergillus indologenus CBS 114.80]|uniref:Uncharacterized protein n=1 Tax=Aspergillus indologenus CBS 114.80 TaxID=1450541 RepID=A0A2V5IZ66_9EURO|nr:hypothetical protein BP00DRAFT_451699 [Aspergillus indologenus CBS 114.80]